MTPRGQTFPTPLVYAYGHCLSNGSSFFFRLNNRLHVGILFYFISNVIILLALTVNYKDVLKNSYPTIEANKI